MNDSIHFDRYLQYPVDKSDFSTHFRHKAHQIAIFIGKHKFRKNFFDLLFENGMIANEIEASEKKK